MTLQTVFEREEKRPEAFERDPERPAAFERDRLVRVFDEVKNG